MSLQIKNSLVKIKKKEVVAAQKEVRLFLS